jgi:hypothetical protein
MKKFIDVQGAFIIGAIIIGLLLNATNCVSDDNCDPDPLYGGCSSSCDYGNASQWATKSFGVWVLLNLGGFLGMESLKKKENLKKFLSKESLKYTVREIDNEWKIEEQESNENTERLIRSLKKKGIL